MVDGVSGLNGTNVQLRVGVHNIAEQGFATTQHQLMVVMTALLMVQLTPKQRTVEQVHAQVLDSLSFKKGVCIGEFIMRTF